MTDHMTEPTDTTVTAVDLRAVAADIREKATQATEGPWEPGERCIWRAGSSTPIVSDGRHGDGGFRRPEDTEYAAAWHPGVALAVADWLDGCANRHDLTSSARLEHDPTERDWYEPAAAVVRAWRGEQP